MSTGTKTIEQYFNDHIIEWMKSPNIIGGSTELIDKKNPKLGKAVHLMVDNKQNPSVLNIQNSIKNDKHEVVILQQTKPFARHMMMSSVNSSWNSLIKSNFGSKTCHSSVGAVIKKGTKTYVMTCGHDRAVSQTATIDGVTIGMISKKTMDQDADVSIIRIKDEITFAGPSANYNTRQVSTTIAKAIVGNESTYCGAVTTGYQSANIEADNFTFKDDDGLTVLNTIKVRFQQETVVGDSGCALMMTTTAGVSLVGILTGGGADTIGTYDAFTPIHSCYKAVGFDPTNDKLVLS